MHDKVIDQVDMPGTKRGLRLKAKFIAGGYILEAEAAVASAMRSLRPGPATKAPFIIFGRGRSGSTLLVKLLDSHPDITCLGEILRYPVTFPNAYIRNCVSSRGHHAVGFKLLSYQLKNGLKLQSGQPLLRRLSNDGYQIIYLHRLNLFRHAISNLYAVKRGVYHHQNHEAGSKTVIRIRPEEILSWMEGSEALGRYEREALEGLPHSEIKYENDLATAEAQQLTYQRIVSDLGLPSVATTAALRKVTPENLGDFVENVDEVLAAVENSRFAGYLKIA